MRPDVAGRALFDRAVTIHRQDCEVVAGGAAGGFAASEVEEAPAWTAAPDAVVAYRVGAAKVFDTLRCLIGQLAGLMILAHASGRREILDLPDLGIATARLGEAEAALAVLSAPGGIAAHKVRLDQARRQIAESHAAFARLGEVGGGAAALAQASERIAAAYQTLKAASDVEAGLTMVDFRQACCTCTTPKGSRSGGRP